MQLEWDTIKAAENETKHGVTFEEAETVFTDDHAAFFADELHSDEEERSTIVGYSHQNRLLHVTFTERNEKARLISARPVTKKERERHEQEPNF